MNDIDNRTWIALNNSYNIDLSNFEVENTDIYIIAHSLSLLCRFTGHCRTHYSVADHSVRLSLKITDPKMSLTGLMHDSAEAFLGDISRPVKNLIRQHTSVLDEVEDHILSLLADKFGFIFPIPSQVKALDDKLLSTESNLIPGNHEWWTKDLPKPFDETIYPCPAALSCEHFLKRFEHLTKAIKNDREADTE